MTLKTELRKRAIEVLKEKEKANTQEEQEKMRKEVLKNYFQNKVKESADLGKFFANIDFAVYVGDSQNFGFDIWEEDVKDFCKENNMYFKYTAHGYRIFFN